ncbi:Cation/H(+) antiporter 1, partial [Dichanthelium oligosanthes]
LPGQHTMARSFNICPHIDPVVMTRVPGVALDTLFLIVLQALAVILLGKFLHLFLRRYNQPSAVSQILAGVAVGGMGLRNAIVHVDVDDVEDMYGGYISAARVIYMFLVGLDLDLAALRNATRRCAALAYATVAASLLVAAIVSSGMYGSMMHSPVKTPELLAATLMLALTNTSSITVSRIAGELNLTVSENGRIVVGAAIITNLICVVGDGLLSSTTLAKEKTQDMYRGSPQIKKGFLALAVAGVAVWLVRPAVTRINQRNVGQHHVRTRDLVTMLLLIWSISSFQQVLGFDGMPTSLALGMAFPREGPAARSIADALAPPINGFVLPFYFATIGMRLDYNSMSGAIIVPGMLLTLLGLVGKAIGAAAASTYLDIPVSEALRYSVLLNVKGHVDTMNMKFAKSEGVWAEQALYAMIIGNLISTIIAGPAAAAVLHREKEAYRTRHQAVESLGAQQELRMLACAHNPHATPGILSLVELLVTVPQEQPAVPVLHFFEVPRERAARTPYHQRTRGGEDKGGPDAITQMNMVVDVFSRATGISFRQADVVSLGATRDAAVACRGAEDAHASLVLVPCYKEQRFDGKMACRLEERRKLNHDMLAAAPCTVGLLVDRPYRASGTSFQTPISVAPESGRTLVHPCSDRTVTHVIAAVFLGGPDDREAVSFASRLAEHPAIGLTVFRFVKRSTYDTVTSSTSRASAAAAGDDLDVSIQECDVDERFLWRFYENYAARELAMYVEKVVERPADVVETLEGMAGMFSLVVVGRGGRQPVELMAGLDRWEEAGSEIGPVAEILASNESLEMGSVLIMQQHTVPLTPPCQ